MATKKNADTPKTKLLPDDLRADLIKDIKAIDAKTPELPVRVLVDGKGPKGMGQASYGFAVEMALGVQIFPEILPGTYDETIDELLVSVDDTSELHAWVAPFAARVEEARLATGQITMIRVNLAYRTLRELQKADPKYRPLYLKVKVFHDKAKSELAKQKKEAKAAAKAGKQKDSEN